MKNLSITIAILSLVCFFGIQKVTAQKKSAPLGDARVTNALNQTKTPFTVDNKGTYQVTFELPNKRRQTIIIMSETEKIGNVELRAVISYAAISDKLPPAEVANQLLQKNMDQISFWSLLKLDDGHYALVNMIYIPADLDGKKLDSIFNTVVYAADEMEERLTKKDEF
ncbi:MAG: hypothetical protein M3209_09295 [Acidobacteriota bacterium]|nr:hypothetical protein [Acidobacteriota bacterium]